MADDNNGISMIIGGANEWSCYGGSRLIYAENNKIKRFDCTQNQQFNFSLNNGDLPCGIVSAVYMVPWTSNLTFNEQTVNDGSGALYNDAQGIGFYTQENFLPSDRARVEIDLIEASGKNFQTTLHGKYYGDSAGIPDHCMGINPNGGTTKVVAKKGYIDTSGIWTSPYAEGNENAFGPGSSNIDSTQPYDVQCSLTPTYNNDKGYYDLQLKTIVSQNENSYTNNVATTKPNIDWKQCTNIGFPKEDLQNMVFIISLWIDPKNTKWLDGNLVGAIPSKRGPCTDEDYTMTAAMQQAINAQSIPDCHKNNIYKSIFFNFSYKNPVDSSQSSFVLDYQYRGINDPPKAPGTFNPVKAQNWVGRYNYSYGICNIGNGAEQITPSPASLKFNSQDLSDPKKGYSDICNTLFPNNKSHHIKPPQNCDWNSNDHCNFMPFTLTAPTPPTPPTPPPTPPPPSPPTPPPPPKPTPPPKPSYKKSKLNTMQVLGIIFGVILFLALIAILFYYIYRKKNATKGMQKL